MNKFRVFLLVVFFGLLFAIPALAVPADNNSSFSAGKILLDTNVLGGLWYVYPGDFHRYYVGSPEDAYKIIRNLSLGVSNADFIKISSSTPDRLKGMFIIKVEDVGRVFYINPSDKSFVYVQNPKTASYLLKNISVYMASDNLETIPVGKIVADSAGNEISREWQFLGFWGSINASYVPVMAAPSFKAKRLGAFSTINRIKILAVVKGDGSTWYKIDGGRYPGAYVEAKFVSSLPQPMPDQNISLPKTVKAGDYWMDLNITKEILTLFKGIEPVLSTYVSTGMKPTPTIVGTFNIQYKYKKTRMHGGPPLATHYYDLPNVPWTMYYHGSFGVHGAYWHDEFGVSKSSGCTNTTIGDAKFIFDQVGPDIGTLGFIRATADNPGTVVNNHY
jgi:hypothetical protein